jgi:DNA-directed RNA polymerase subunit RPC12/RpoP
LQKECSKCGKRLVTGTRVFQLSKGRYYLGQETPTYSYGPAVILEGHETCFDDFPMESQYAPYKCLACKRKIKHGAEVVYGVLGSKPASQYTRPEGRGHTLPFIAHVSCWESG